jgi:tRNA dimethylallyltransferase
LKALEGRASLVVLLGPTASGKTEISISWARRLGFEILSADSMQVYRFMDIGTAKPSREVREEIPHHMIDVVFPDEPYNAARFQREADRAIEEIRKRGRPVLVVAGTGLYLRALTRGLFEGVESDPSIRRTLHQKARKEGVGALYQMLRDVDPERAQRIHPHDLFRIVRALEVFMVSGTPMSDHHKKHGLGKERYRTLYLGVERDRRDLFQRIERRVDRMIREGLKEEVQRLLAMGYDPGLSSMKAIGYKHMASHLMGLTPLDEAVRQMKRDTKRFARRQLTWFKAMDGVKWFRPEEAEDLLPLIEDFLEGQ